MQRVYIYSTGSIAAPGEQYSVFACNIRVHVHSQCLRCRYRRCAVWSRGSRQPASAGALVLLVPTCGPGLVVVTAAAPQAPGRGGSVALGQR